MANSFRYPWRICPYSCGLYSLCQKNRRLTTKSLEVSEPRDWSHLSGIWHRGAWEISERCNHSKPYRVASRLHFTSDLMFRHLTTEWIKAQDYFQSHWHWNNRMVWKYLTNNSIVYAMVYIKVKNDIKCVSLFKLTTNKISKPFNICPYEV